MRKLAGVLAASIIGMAGAPEAHAAGTCVYDAGTKTVTANAEAVATSLLFTVDNSGAISFDGTACGGATTANTTAVNINGANRFLTMQLGAPVTTTLITVTATTFTGLRDISAGGVTWVSGSHSGNQSAADLDGDGIAEVVSANTSVQLDGFTGDDTLSGAGGFQTPGGTPVGPNDVYIAGLTGGPGADTLTGPGEMRPASGNDTLIAGATGTTTLRYGDAGPTTGVKMKSDLSGTEAGWDGFNGTDTYVGFLTTSGRLNFGGSGHDDLLYGTPGPNDMQSGDGDDEVHALGGNDHIRGGLGADELYGGEGNDEVAGNTFDFPGADVANVLRGGPGRDKYSGSDQGDDFGPVLDNEVDTVNCYGGADTGRADAGDVLSGCEFAAPPALTLGPSSASVDEGGTAQLTLTLSEALPFPVEVDVLDLEGTATSGPDFAPLARRVTIAAGETTATVDVSALADDEDETPETFTVALANSSPAPALGSNLTVTIADKTTPVTTVTVAPGTGSGTGGTHLAPPTLTVSAPAPATEIRCVLDPAAAPATFADLPAGDCAYLGAGRKVTADGTHTLCAASTSTTTSDTSPVACTTWTTDATPPAVTCATDASFLVGDVDKAITAGVADATSGPLHSAISAPAATATSGERTATLVGQDKAGNVTTVQCRYSVSSVALCGQPVVLLTVQLAGRRVQLGGLAAPRYAGQTVTLTSSGKRVGEAKVAADGSFSLTVKAPKASRRGKAKYQATLPDGASTRSLRLVRSLIISKRVGNTIHGKVLGRKRPKRVVFYRQSTCTQSRVFGRAKVSRSGTFKLALAGPAAPEAIALYRVKAAIGKGSSYTVPIVVRGTAS